MPRLMSDDGWLQGFRRRGGVWVPVTRWRHSAWPVVIEWVMMTAIGLCIIAAGGLIGAYRAHPALDVQSRTFANASVDAIAPTWNRAALLSRASPELSASASGPFAPFFDHLRHYGIGARNQGCFGRSAFSLVSRRTPMTAQYSCEMALRDKIVVVALSLRKDIDAWRITAFYVSPPQRRVRPWTAHSR